MGLFDKIFNRKRDPLSDISVGKRFGDYEDYMKKFTVALEDSYKDFLMTVTSSIIGCRKGTDLYAILDIAKKVEAESVESKGPESEKRLSEYKEKIMMGRKDESVKIRALNRYQISLLKEVYDEHCLPEVQSQIAKSIVTDCKGKLDDVVKMLRNLSYIYKEDRPSLYGFKYPDPFAQRVLAELQMARKDKGEEVYYKPGAYECYKDREYSDFERRRISIHSQGGLEAISKELGLPNKNALRDILINEEIHGNMHSLVILCKDWQHWFAKLDMSLKELKDIVPFAKDMSDEEYYNSFYRESLLDDNRDGFKPHMFATAERYLNWHSGSRTNSRNKIVADTLLDDAKKYVDEFFDYVKEQMQNESVGQKTNTLKQLVVKNMSPFAFRQNYPTLASAINDAVKSDPAKYEPMIATMWNAAVNDVKDIYKNEGIQAYLEDKDPWNSLHPNRVSTIVNNETYIAYERDSTNTPTFYVFGAVDKKTLKEINEVISDRLKTRCAAEGNEYHIVISDGKSEDAAYKAALGKPRSLAVIKPSEENKETRRWLQPVVKYKVDNGYERAFFGPTTKEKEKGSNQQEHLLSHKTGMSR